VVFRKDRHLRFYFTNQWGEAALKGRLRALRTPSAGFEFQMARLKFDRHPPSRPRPGTDWRQAEVISGAAYQALLARVLERLAPARRREGIYFQTPFGEGVLYRDAEGRVRVRAGREPPDAIPVRQRFGIEEFGHRLSDGFSEALRHVNDGHELICLVPPPIGRQTVFELLDRERRQAVLCLAPLPARALRGGASPIRSGRDLLTLILEGHVWACVKNPVSSAGRLLDRGRQSLVGLFAPRLRSPRRPPPPLRPHAPPMDLPAWEAWLDRHTSSRREAGTVRFLIDGERFFPVFQQRLREARDHIHLLVGIFDNDDVAVRIADLLRAKSRTIEVRVLLDRFSSLASSRSWPLTPLPEGFHPPPSIGAYLEGGSRVHVRPFLNTWGTAEHSKVYLIDGRYAYLGGMNLGREYRYEWHDLMSEVEGPIVASLEWEFAKAWAHAGALGDLAFVARKWFGERPPVPAESGTQASLRYLRTRTTGKEIRRAVLEALARARREVFLENPYLFSNEVIVALARARQRGVDVRVVLGTRNNMAGGPGSNLVVANYLLDHGARVYLYPGMSHIKALYVDGWACWGSANFSGLSLRNNQEVNLATSDPAIAAALRRRLFERDFAKSFELTHHLDATWTDSLAHSLLNQLWP
jgi:cardiolipin synthase